MNIGSRLRALREANDLSQGDIERRSGLLRSYISRVEGGYTRPSLDTLEKFARALAVQPYELLFTGRGRPTAAKMPRGPQLSEPTRKLLKDFEGMSSADRRLLLALAKKLSR
jgi:transcriptional regulator with XRE-family HTH domain